MADKKADINPNNEDEATILGDAVRKKEIKVILEKGRGKTHEVWQKDLPDNLPTDWLNPETGQKQPITWINNFGVKHRDADQYIDNLDFSYTIELDIAPHQKAVYFDGSAVQLFKDAARVNGKMRATLNLGDPATGLTP